MIRESFSAVRRSAAARTNARYSSSMRSANAQTHFIAPSSRLDAMGSQRDRRVAHADRAREQASAMQAIQTGRRAGGNCRAFMRKMVIGSSTTIRRFPSGSLMWPMLIALRSGHFSRHHCAHASTPADPLLTPEVSVGPRLLPTRHGLFDATRPYEWEETMFRKVRRAEPGVTAKRGKVWLSFLSSGLGVQTYHKTAKTCHVIRARHSCLTCLWHPRLFLPNTDMRGNLSEVESRRLLCISCSR